MNAPERIKAWFWNGRIDSGQWHVNGQGPTTEYVRADLYDAQAAEIADLRRQLAEVQALRAERDSFRAVLEGAGYGDIDGIAKNTVEQSHLLGETVMHLTLAQGNRAEAAEAEVLEKAIDTLWETTPGYWRRDDIAAVQEAIRNLKGTP